MDINDIKNFYENLICINKPLKYEYPRIYTSCFSNLKKLLDNGHTNLISIAGQPSDEFQKLLDENDERVFEFKKLAPKYEWWKEWKENNLSDDWYTEKYYKTVLCELDPRIIFFDLLKDQEEIILLCWEEPENFCHRHLVSNWFKENLKSIPVSEWKEDDDIKD